MEIATISISLFVQALGWTVVHSLWQILLVFVLFKLGAWFMSRNNRLSYGWALAAMGMMAIWSAVTFVSVLNRLQAQAAEQAVAQARHFDQQAPEFAAVNRGNESFQAENQISFTLKALDCGSSHDMVWLGLVYRRAFVCDTDVGWVLAFTALAQAGCFEPGH